MAEYATHCMCFQSSTVPTKRTKHMIDLANHAATSKDCVMKEVVVVLF